MEPLHSSSYLDPRSVWITAWRPRGMQWTRPLRDRPLRMVIPTAHRCLDILHPIPWFFFPISMAHEFHVFFFPSQWHMFFFAFPILGRHFVGPLLILFFWKVRRSFLPPYGTPTDQARGVPVFYCGREWLWKGNHQLDFLPRCGQQAILGKEWFNFWWEAWENSVTSGDGGWVKIYDIVYYMGHKWVKICDRMFGEWLSIKQLFQGTFRVGFRCGQGHQFSCIKEGL